MYSQVVGKVNGLDTLEALPKMRLHSQRVLGCNENRNEEKHQGLGRGVISRKTVIVLRKGGSFLRGASEKQTGTPRLGYVQIQFIPKKHMS